MKEIKMTEMEGHCCEFLKYLLHSGDYIYREEEDEEMDIKEEIEELKNKISELEEKIDKEKKEEKDWKPQDGETYWFVNLDWLGFERTYWTNNKTDNIRYAHRVIFKTKNEVEEYLEYLLEKEKHMDTFTEEEWGNIDKDKFSYCYDTDDCKIKDDMTWITRYIKPYFRTKEEVLDFIQKYERQIKHELGVE